jgi:hypothetical protein
VHKKINKQGSQVHNFSPIKEKNKQNQTPQRKFCMQGQGFDYQESKGTL